MDISQQILSDIGIYTKYAKYIPALKRRETFPEIIYRNAEFHIGRFPELETRIMEAYSSVLSNKILPSMRSMQFAGLPIELNPSRIYNCAYLPIDDWRAFPEIMFLLLGGIGVGFSVQIHHIEKLPEIRKPKSDRKKRFLIGDSIEGWADAIKALMKTYFTAGNRIVFDFRDIREKGSPLVTAGGKAPGPGPIRECLVKIEAILQNKVDGEQLTSLEIHDIVCHIADAVLAGGIRRAALISLFSATDEEMMACKTGDWWELNPQRGRANNSVVLIRHKCSEEFFFGIWKKIQASNAGEPGIYFSNDKDWGTNPCCEIALRPFQFCNLSEVNGDTVKDQEDLEQRVRHATILATLQASVSDFHYLRPIWRRTTEKDALLGVGITGIASNKLAELDLTAAAKIAVSTNKEWAKLLGIKPAARITCIKPSGTTSIVLGTSSGIHAWFDEYYDRRMRLGKDEAIAKYLQENHPEILEDDFFRPHDTTIVSLPQRAPEGAILRNKETAIDVLERVKQYSMHWVRPGHITGNNTHNVSATIFIKDSDEWDAVGNWMWINREYYNGLSVLPYDGGSYIQAPFETITKEEYERKMKLLHELDLTKIIEDIDNTNLAGELACAGGGCEI
jgi:ribonucleoside-diphosphate reductase alpha chain